MFRTLLGCLLVFLIISCETDKQSRTNSNLRPVDTWVFRCVLDEKPRMLVSALHKDLYIAINTQKAKLYKAWKGLVNLEGAVYDGAHGPQPTSVGDAYYIDDTDKPVFELSDKNGPLEYKINYKGHRIEDNSLVIMSELITDSDRIHLFERIDNRVSDTGQLVFERSLSVEGLQGELDLYWKSSAVLVDKSQFNTSAELEIMKEEPLEFNSKEFINYSFRLKLRSDQSTDLNYPFLDAVYLDPNIDDGFSEDSGSLPVGAVLIGKNDCKTCHNVSKPTVGPSYIQVAKKYEHSDENKMMLIDKILNGGSGIWGEQVMTPHPEIPKEDLGQMVDYIFGLAEFEGKSSSHDTEIERLPAVDIESSNFISGAITRVFKISPGTAMIPDDLESRRPFQAGILSNFDNISGGDFKALDDNFAIMSKGYLQIEKSGVYSFRMWSDDGSKLYFHDRLYVDNDGLHSVQMAQVSLFMEKGFHPFRIEFFQGEGGRFLSFNMKGEDDEAWKVVPPKFISHDKIDQKYNMEMSLPMSVVSKIPGDQMPLEDVHPSFDLSQARPDDFKKKIGGLDFLSDGRMLVSVWDKDGGVYLIEDHASSDPSEIRVKQIAFGLAEPLGLKVVDDRIFIMQKQEMTELIDIDGDEIIDEYRTLCDDWGVTANFHEFGFGLEAKDGYLYANLATGILPGGAGMPDQDPNRGSCIKVSIEDGSIEFIANGLRTPNGIGLGFRDELYISDNQGDWLPSSKIVHVQKGDWFGSRAVDFEGTEDFVEKKPVVWLPQDEIGNSPSTPLYINIGPYKDQMIHGEVTHGGIKRVFVEEVEGQYQGAVFRFIQGLEAGVNRIRWASDDALYAGGIGNPGNWQHTGKLWYGLQRLAYNGKATFEILAVRAYSDGIEIEFTEPLKDGDGWNKNDYEIKQWYYKPTAEYGGPKLDEKSLEISSVNISEDRTKIFLGLENMEEDHLIYVRLKDHFVSSNENSLWSTEAWYTMNRIPKNKPGPRSANPQTYGPNQLLSSEESAGWKLLFNGRDLEGFHTFNSDLIDSKWTVDGDAIYFDPDREGNGGDLITDESFKDFELALEWKISNCGNSGIFFNIKEDEKYCCPYLTAPEMQILDNTCHPDSRYVTHRAGDLYDMIKCSTVTVKPAGEWNKVRIISKDSRYQFWLNGYKVVEFAMHDSQWDAMVAESKFKDWEDFGVFESGKIGVQDHGDKVWFRNMKIRKL